MAQFTARAAAVRLNRNERTIRRWISQGRLAASHIAINRLAIEEAEIARIERDQGHASKSALERRIDRLEIEFARLSAQLVAGNRRKGNDRPTRSPRPTDEMLISEADLPAGSIRASEFAEAHGIRSKTFRYHMLTGLAGEKVEHLAIGKPGRPGEVERWLSLEQQQAAREFWRRHGIR